jgi:transposase-like protein
LKNRSVEDILLTVDGLKGLLDAIRAVFPDAPPDLHRPSAARHRA